MVVDIFAQLRHNKKASYGLFCHYYLKYSVLKKFLTQSFPM